GARSRRPHPRHVRRAGCARAPQRADGRTRARPRHDRRQGAVVIRSLAKSPSLGEFGISLLTVFLALIVGGLAMAFTGANPLGVYKDLVVGAGFDWPFHLIPGNPLGVNALLAENNLVATLVLF